MMWTIFLILVYSYIATGLLCNLIKIFNFFINKDEKKPKQKLVEKK
jgi:hypothetical protein